MCLLEIDAYPPGAAPALPTPCGLPGGIAFASFHVQPGEISDPSAGTLLRGPDGELIEILRAAPAAFERTSP